MHTSVMLNVYILFNLFLTQKYELQFSLMWSLYDTITYSTL
jgi:hypothetical protein